MPYEVVFASTALEHYRALDARWKATIKDAIYAHLTHEPFRVSKSRIKRLRDMDEPQYRLRVEDYRVFYDIIENDVLIIAIVPKADADDWLNKFGIRTTP